MTIISFIIAVVAVLGSVAAHEPVSWGVAVLMVALLFRLFWKLAKPQDKNK